MLGCGIRGWIVSGDKQLAGAAKSGEPEAVEAKSLRDRLGG